MTHKKMLEVEDRSIEVVDSCTYKRMRDKKEKRSKECLRESSAEFIRDNYLRPGTNRYPVSFCQPIPSNVERELTLSGG